MAVCPDHYRTKAPVATSTAAMGLVSRWRSYRLIKKHNVSDTEFLIGAAGDLTSHIRRELGIQLNHSERYISKMILDAGDTNQLLSFVLAGQSGQRSLISLTLQTLLRHNQPNLALDGRTSTKEVLN